MGRYTAGKYIKSEDALYQVLHAKWPDLTREDFKIRVRAIIRTVTFAYVQFQRYRDIWSYEAPERLTRVEIG